MKKQGTARRVLVLTIALALALSVVSIGVIGTMAAKPEINITIPQPDAGDILLQKGATDTRSTNGGYRAVSGATHIAEASIVSGDLKVTGKVAGRATIAAGSNVGLIMEYNYQVTDPANVAGYRIKDGGEVLLSGPGKSKAGIVSTTPTDALNSITWSSLDSSIATMGSNGTVKGHAKGATILYGNFTDKWGVAREIHILVGVGVRLGDTDLGDLLDLIAKGETILAERDTNGDSPYTADTLAALLDAVNQGKGVVDSNSPTDNQVADAIRDLTDAINGMHKKPVRPNDIIGPDGNGDYYRPVGDPENVYEVVDELGNGKQPPKYVYNEDGDPVGKPEKNRPARPDKGIYWVEAPDGSNIYKKVNSDGTLQDTPAKWGGEDGIFGTADDKDVILLDGSYWVDMGQNVYRKATGKNPLGPLTGGGPNKRPGTEGVTPIYEHSDGKFFVGPLPVGESDPNKQYYYGDKVGGNGLLDSTAQETKADDVKYYKDANGNMVTTPPGILGPDTDGNYYKPVGEPENVYEVVDGNGNGKQPPEYVYNHDGNPVGRPDKNRPARPKDGDYWVEDPDGSNIYKKVKPDGTLQDTPAKWGGEDGIFGTGDDKDVVLIEGSYWVDRGQNVYQKATGKNPLGPLTGGGPNKKPGTESVTPIYEHNGKFYVGPLPIGESNPEKQYYYGDKANGNGLLDSTNSALKVDDVKYYLINGQMVDKRPITEPGAGNGVDGRILTDEETGDGEWIEIARNGDYSLIVRRNFINTYKQASNKNDPAWQGVYYGNNYAYNGSDLQTTINNWFTGNNIDGAQDKLAANARLRDYTVKNTMINTIGTGSGVSSYLTNGLSKPIAEPDRTGLNVAFALSYSEAANYISMSYRTNQGGTAQTNSQDIARANFAKLTKLSNHHEIWLRSPGTNTYTGSAIAVWKSSSDDGNVFQVDGLNLVYPALWVHQDIFNP